MGLFAASFLRMFLPNFSWSQRYQSMNEAAEWLRFVPERDRRLVSLALAYLAVGNKRVPWMRLKAVMGVRFGADGLRMRYARAVATICQRLNSAEMRAGGVSR